MASSGGPQGCTRRAFLPSEGGGEGEEVVAQPRKGVTYRQRARAIKRLRSRLPGGKQYRKCGSGICLRRRWDWYATADRK